MSGARASILFVCTGNICRSPLAEGLFLRRVNGAGAAKRFEVDSAGTMGWNAGSPPDSRMVAEAARHGVVLASTARQVREEDFARFDLLVCMDHDNHEALLEMGASPDKVRLLMEFDPRSPVREVPDPYHGGEDGFRTVFGLVDQAVAAMLDHLTRNDKTTRRQNVKTSRP